MTTLIIAGHGMQRNGVFDPGASGYIKKGEHKYMVEDLFPAIKRHLPKGENVVFYSEKKVSNHGNLVQLVKQHNAKTVVEFHFDAHKLGSSASGGHVIIHTNKTPDTLDLALRDAIKNMVGVRYSHKGQSGISGRNNLYNVNQAANNRINYRLVELGFGTNKNDADIMVDQVDEYAKELVKAITGTATTTKTYTPKPAKKPSAPAKTKSNLKIDGKWGRVTTRALQRYLGTTVDGIISDQVRNSITSALYGATVEFGTGTNGSLVIKALQRKLGNLKVDGLLGPLTVKRLQTVLGTTVDSKLSRPSLVVKGLQRRLNAGNL